MASQAGYRVRALSIAVLCAIATAEAQARAEAPPIELGDGVQIALVEVPAGSFTQGSALNEPGHGDDEGRREVTISKPFWIGRTPVTVGQFRKFAAEARYVTEAEKGSSGGFGWDGTKLVQRKEFTWRSPGFPQTESDPVVIVTFADAQAFAGWAAQRSGMTVRLPTEAEWEMAARGGSKGRFFWGNDETQAEARAWFAKNAGQGTKPAGSKSPNDFGLLDAAGNVWQWCLDFHGPISADAATDPEARSPVTWAHSDKPRRVLKGGSWLTDDRWKMRPAARNRATEGSRNADFGFRIVAMRGAPPGPLPSGTPPPSPAPGSTAPPTDRRDNRHWDAGLGCGAFGCGGLFFFGILFWIARAALKGGTGGVEVQKSADGFWLIAPGQQKVSVTYAVRTLSGTKQGSAVADPAPRGTFVYTGEPALDVKIVSTAAFGGAAPQRQREEAWQDTSSHDDSSWASRHHSSSSSSSTSWPSAY